MNLSIYILKIIKHLGLSKLWVDMQSKHILYGKLKYVEAFDGYEPKAHDVFVATFVKSGTNWMLQIAQQIAHYGHSEFDHIHDVVPWPDGVDSIDSVSLEDMGVVGDSPTNLRAIKTHVGAQKLPYNDQAKYIVVIRDPKEVLVSSYHFFCGMFGVKDRISLVEWFELFIKPNSYIGSWIEHTAGYWLWKDRANVLIVTYDELKKDLSKGVDKVAEIMNVDLDEIQRAKVIERSSFKYMKKYEKLFEGPRSPYIKRDNAPKMIRNGGQGGEGIIMSEENLRTIDALCLQELKRLGSTFPYAELFST